MSYKNPTRHTNPTHSTAKTRAISEKPQTIAHKSHKKTYQSKSSIFSSISQKPIQKQANGSLTQALKTKMEEIISSNSSPIPVIDLGEFEIGRKGYEKLREACENWGCFRIINHKVPLTSMAEMKSTVRALLDLPVEIKRRNADVIAGSGYVGPSEVNPLYEALGLYDMGSSVAVDTFCSQLDASPHQREVIENYAKAIYELSMDIAKKLAESLGIVGGDPFKGWPCQFRINKYHFTPDSVGSCGVQIHTDSGFLTILQEDESVGGLEVMDMFGNFVAVDPLPGTLLVNLGDVAKVWSNGRLCNVKHRVQCKEASIRISIATFLLAPRSDYVETLSEFVDSEHPRLYVPFVYENYRKLRVSTKLQAGEALDHLRVQS